MTHDELYRCRCDLSERYFPADEWTDAEIERLPEWWALHGAGLDLLLLTGCRDFVDCPMIDGEPIRYPENILRDVVDIENGCPTNRLAILHLLPTNSIQPKTVKEIPGT